MRMEGGIMQLAFRNTQGTVRTNWSEYALLRDNVQHYLENGAPSERFAALHAKERAVDGQVAVLDAARLRGEVLGAWYALKKFDLESTAVSLRTHLLLSGLLPPPRVRGTLLAARAGWSLPVTESEQSLGEVCGASSRRFLQLRRPRSTAIDSWFRVSQRRVRALHMPRRAPELHEDVELAQERSARPDEVLGAPALRRGVPTEQVMARVRQASGMAAIISWDASSSPDPSDRSP